MTTRIRKNYTVEFKQEAASLVIDQRYKVAEAARNLDIHSALLGRWVREAKENPGQAFPGKGRLNPEGEENRRLREENKRLRTERDILKKATAFFAKESR